MENNDAKIVDFSEDRGHFTGNFTGQITNNIEITLKINMKTVFLYSKIISRLSLIHISEPT
jgi:hypothetical protein